MLKSWSIENFKPIVNSGTLQFAPVTVLAGRNSSGKSSLIQSILMVAQTLANQLPDRALLPNGPLVQLGTFESILSNFSRSRKLALKFELDFRLEELGPDLDIYRSSAYDLSVLFDSASTAYAAQAEAARVVVENVSLKYHFEFIEPSLIENLAENGGHATSLSDGDLRVQKMVDSQVKSFREKLAVDHPQFVSSIIERTVYVGEYWNDDRNDKDGERYLVTLSHFLPQNLRKIPTKKSEDTMNMLREELQAYLEPDYVGDAVKQIERFFASKIRYLGPLRDDPASVQRSFAPTSELDEVGARGEYAAVVYHTHRDSVIEWYNSESKQVERGTLKIALDAWVRYLGIANEISTEIAGPLGVTWKVVLKEGQKARTLPEVGGGVNHILPILVMGLLSPRDTLLIVEEPEVTLHPTVQARLGDFFVGQSKCQKQFLIETHSENLVSQLRYHIVESGGMEKSDCMIYFVDQDEKGAAQFEPVQISPQGNILNWPDGFFDETMRQEDRITAASIRKRAKLAKND